MDHIVGHLVRRGVDAHANYRTGKPDGNHEFEMPPLGVFTLAVTAIGFLLALGAIDYTYGHLVATLTMVESPAVSLYESIPNCDVGAPLDEKKPLEPDLVCVKQVPITSSFRKTILHLRAHAGRLSRFRGLSVWLVYQFIFSRLTELFSAFNIVPRGLDAVLAAVILARLRMVWTHIVISEPSPKYWFRRIASIKSWKQVAVPTAILAICEQLAVGLPVYLFHAFGLNRVGPQLLSSMDQEDIQLLVGKFFAVFALGFFIAIAVVVPASVSLTRVHASLLSEDEATIVTFDRSFGRIIPFVAWGSSAIGMLDAWKTFNWNSRLRLLKVYVKVAAMQMGLALFFLAAVIAQLHIFVGEDLLKMLQVGSEESDHEAINN